ncbi:TPA: CD1107 family mobile element protein [Streptococcus suis]
MKKKILSGLLLTTAFISLSIPVVAEEPTTTTTTTTEVEAPPYGREMTEAERKAWESKLSEKEKEKEKALNDTIEAQIKANTPASVTGEKFEGNGTVVDFSTSGSKAFYTIQDQNQQVFYLIIDLDKVENNVYFLSDISKDELAKVPTSNSSSGLVPETTEVTQEVAVQEQPIPESNNNGFLFSILLVGLLGAGAYYFMVIKPKGTKKTNQKPEEEGEVVIGDE